MDMTRLLLRKLKGPGVRSAGFWDHFLPMALDGQSGLFVQSGIRLSAADLITLDKAVTATPDQGYRFAYQTRNAETGAVLTDSGWKSAATSLPVRTPFTMTIKRADNGAILQTDVYHVRFSETDGAGAAGLHRGNRLQITRNAAGHGVAHRGGAIGPENTLPAFAAAVENGFLMVETDVCHTADGEAVLLHDDTVGRTARNADGSELSEDLRICDITLEQARALDFGIYKGAAWAGTQIPTYREFLLWAAESNVTAIVELKATGVDAEQVPTLIETTRSCGMLDRVIWACFDTRLLQAVREFAPLSELLYLAGEDAGTTEEIMQELTALDAGLDIKATQLTDELLTACIEAGRTVDVWTVNELSAALGLDRRVRHITTDYLWGLECLLASQQTGEVGTLLVP